MAASALCASGESITKEDIISAEKLFGLNFSEEKIDMMLPGIRSQEEDYKVIHSFPLSNSIFPAVQFNPVPPGFKFERRQQKFRVGGVKKMKMPANMDDIAFFSIEELASLIKTKQISSESLTRFYIDRLKRIGPRLECVVTLTEDLAMEQARRADSEIKAGKYRGLLHGIPYGAKDLLSARGIRTTWGAGPYTNQVFSKDATVVRKLEEAGAVLVAKMTLGELAMGETWFGGMTRNPWNLKEGSSGSSAGSSAATSAGLLPFAIGTETYGSIVSPCDRCGVTGLRPSYGRVSRTGAMALSWSMDKIGPICRTAEDCAIVFHAIYGPDGEDPTVYDLPFNYRPDIKLQKSRIGFLKADFDSEKGERATNDARSLAELEKLGARLNPVRLPDFPVGNISFVLSTEGATAFDDLTRSGKEDWLKQQDRGSWPNTFRRRQFVPAVEYLKAQQIRWLLVQETAKLFEEVDVIVVPSLTGRSSLLGNLTGNPCVVVPNGFTKKGAPTSICFIGKLFDEGTLLAVAKRYQDATDWHKMHPVLN